MSSAPEHAPEMVPMTIEHTAYVGILAPDEVTPETPLLLALHGYGQSSKRFLRDFKPLRERGVLVVAPQGPSQLYMRYDPPAVGFSWLTKYEKENSIADFLKYMAQVYSLIGQRYPSATRKTLLLGFSQGVAMAYRVAARAGVHPSGLIACCADMPPDVADLLTAMPRFPVLLVHGKDDPLISIEKSYHAETQLKEWSYPVDTHFFDGGHLLEPPQVEHIADWICERV